MGDHDTGDHGWEITDGRPLMGDHGWETTNERPAGYRGRPWMADRRRPRESIKDHDRPRPSYQFGILRRTHTGPYGDYGKPREITIDCRHLTNLGFGFGPIGS